MMKNTCCEVNKTWFNLTLPCSVTLGKSSHLKIYFLTCKMQIITPLLDKNLMNAYRANRDA